MIWFIRFSSLENAIQMERNGDQWLYLITGKKPSELVISYLYENNAYHVENAPTISATAYYLQMLLLWGEPTLFTANRHSGGQFRFQNPKKRQETKDCPLNPRLCLDLG